MALSAKDDPVSRWHQRQWQQWTIIGPVFIPYLTWPQSQPPSNDALLGVKGTALQKEGHASGIDEEETSSDDDEPDD